MKLLNNIKILKYFILFCIAVICNISIVFSQSFVPYNEIGLIGGTSYYLGDLNNSHFNTPQIGGGLVFRRNIDRRFAYKAAAIVCSLQADDRNNKKDPIAQDRGLHFKSHLYEFSAQIEFNFLPYEIGNPLYTWTPFLFTGGAGFYFNPIAETSTGQWVYLQELGTEGQGTPDFPEREKYSLVQFAVPMGGGLKISIGESTNIILEYGIRKLFTDYLDDVSKTYPGATVMQPYGQLAQEMSDPTNNHIRDEQRGDSQDNDWYSFAGITISIKFKNSIESCLYD